MKRNKPMHLLALLATGVLLAACQAKEEAHPQPVTPSSSSVVVAQSSSSTKASSSKASSSKRLQAQAAGQDASQVAEGSEGAAATATVQADMTTSSAIVEETSVASETTDQAPVTEVTPSEELVQVQEEQAAEPTVSASATEEFEISKENLSRIVGTWANAEGQTFTVNPDGSIWMGTSAEDGSMVLTYLGSGLENGVFGIHLGGYDENGQPAGGVGGAFFPAGVENHLGYVNDTDHIEIGHDISRGESNKQYYRQ